MWAICLFPLSYQTSWAPPQISSEPGRTKKLTSQGIPATRGKVNGGSRLDEEGKKKALRDTSICTRALPLLTWLYIAWHNAHSYTMAITAKAHSEWKILDEAHFLLCKIDMVQWVYHFYNYSHLNDPLLISNARGPICPWILENSFYKELSLIKG